jgi:hypothetical protein
MGPGGVFPAEMPERGHRLAGPLDDNTAERLVAGRLGPDDAPPGYAGVARVLQAAAGPADPGELAGREAALAIFRVHGPASGAGRPGPRHRPRGRARGRLVALALAGVVAAGGLWMTDGARTVPGLRALTGGAGGAGPATPGAGARGTGAPGLVNQARPTTPVTGTGATGRVAAGAGERPTTTTTRPGGVGAGGGSARGARPNRPGKPPKPKPKPKSKPGPQAPRQAQTPPVAERSTPKIGRKLPIRLSSDQRRPRGARAAVHR